MVNLILVPAHGNAHLPGEPVSTEHGARSKSMMRELDHPTREETDGGDVMKAIAIAIANANAGKYPWCH